VSTDSRCTSEFLKATFGKFAAVKAAYCNADYLVVHSTSAPHWTPYLDDAKTPPGGTDTVNGACRTRTASITASSAIWKIPLSVTKLSTDSGTVNNIGAFDGAGDSLASGLVGYLVNTSDTSIYYGLNARGAAGFTVGGQEIFPVYNNRAQYTPQDCEVDACNEHVGQGGGQPHLHGDPFHSTDGTCLYGPANYTSDSAHPPLWGFSLDGYNIYGRHLSANNEGYSTALDDCGGHEHGAWGYHYHSQVITAYTSTGAQRGVVTGQPYAVYPPGVFKCWKGDITSVPGGKAAFWSSDKNSAYLKPCTGATNYYAASGITISGAGSQSGTTPVTPTVTSKPVASPTVTNAPTAAPTPMGTSKPTAATPVVTSKPATATVSLCKDGNGSDGRKCPRDTSKGACPAGCSVSKADGGDGGDTVSNAAASTVVSTSGSAHAGGCTLGLAGALALAAAHLRSFVH